MVERIAEARARRMPSVSEQAKNLAGAVGRSAKRIIKGEPIKVPDKVQLDRWAKCKACDQLKGHRCLLCGCHMEAKTWWASEECKKGHWHEYKETN